jgi:steroid delta-isomerase-like uncharacterized protein
MTRSEIVTLLARWQDAFARRDLDTYSSLYAEDAILESPMAGSLTGRDAVVRFVGAFISAFPDAKLTTEPPLIDGDRIAMVSTVAGSQTGKFMGLPPSGKPFRFPLIFLLTIRDGLIVRDRRIYDFTGLLVQVGVLKAKPT